MDFRDFSFGSIRIDGETYDYDVVIDRGEIRKRKKKASRASGKSLGTRRFPSKSRFLGIASGW